MITRYERASVVGPTRGAVGSGRLSPVNKPTRLAAALIVSAGVATVYYHAAVRTASRSVDLLTAIDTAIPFVPWTWWIYFPGYLAALLLAVFAIRRDDVFVRALLAILVATVICAFVYAICPSRYPRPTDAVLTGLTGDALRWFWTIDPPNNTFPSAHVAISTIAALAMWRDRNPLAWLSVASTVGVIVTVHTTKQHYWIDAVAGLVVARVADRLVGALWSTRRSGTSRSTAPAGSPPACPSEPCAPGGTTRRRTR